jgi:WD40 repeat protein
VFDRVGVRRARRVRTRRIQAALLAGVVIAATTGGFLALRRAFDDKGRSFGDQTTRPLPANGEIIFSRPLPDGSEHLFAVQPGQEGERRITPVGKATYREPSISPDGRTIVVAHSIPSFEGESFASVIATVPIEGGSPTWLTDPVGIVQDPEWSPDGTKIAFAGRVPGGGGAGIHVMNADGSDIRLIAGSDSFDVLSPDWSPDGSRIVFMGWNDGVTQPDLYSIALAGSDLTNLTKTPDVDELAPAWSPDGSLIAFITRPVGTAEGTIDLVTPRGYAAGRVPEIGDGVVLDELDWSPDGRFIAFLSDLALNDSDTDGDLDLWTVRPNGSDLRNLTTESVSGITWQPLPASVEQDPRPTESPSPSPGSEGIPATVAGIPFPVCGPMWIPGDFGGDGPEEVIVFEEASDADCSSTGRSHLGIRDAATGAVTSYSGPIPQILTRLRTVWPYSTPDLDGDGVDEVAFGWTDEGHTDVVLFRLAILTGFRPGDARVFEPVEWECGPGCDRYQPVTIGRVGEATAGMYCGRFEVPHSDEREGIVHWSTGLQTELGHVRAYRYRYEAGIMRFETSTSWSVEPPDAFPPTGAQQLCGSPSFRPADFPSADG